MLSVYWWTRVSFSVIGWLVPCVRETTIQENHRVSKSLCEHWGWFSVVTFEQLKRKKKDIQGVNSQFQVTFSVQFNWNSIQLFSWKVKTQTYPEWSEFPYDDGLPVLTAHDLVDVEGVGLDIDASVQPQSAVNQSSLLRLRLGRGLAQPGSSQTHRPHGGVISSSNLSIVQ